MNKNCLTFKKTENEKIKEKKNKVLQPCLNMLMKLVIKDMQKSIQ